MEKTLILQRLLGGVYFCAGIAKAFRSVEDVPALLLAAAQANAGTILEGPSVWFAEHPTIMAVLVGLGFVSSATCQLTDRLVVPASVVQICMLLCFSTFLHRHVPPVIAVDLVFATLGGVVIWASRKRAIA